MNQYSLFLLMLILGRWVQPQALGLPSIVNFNAHCMRCLCHAATGCSRNIGCERGYCGPFKISRVYWKDAGEITLRDDEKQRDGAYQDCARSFRCAQTIIHSYLVKYGRDCNGDGVTDCEDYSMINFNGGYQCGTPLEQSAEGRAWLERYRTCNPKPIF